ncbi:hypothetical protein FB451DRAFT_1388305 [Mycena latifolia]|nr:hypothetical protein FB451DRAFT_1388305 [Mycena latifolia]
MPPLTRQRTLESVLSWWSDSNPAGATIDLHAATKLLMKLMYHRQALAFLKRNHSVPLTPTTLDIYRSYVSWQYVSSETKNAILRNIATRTRSEDEARVVADSDMLDTILQMARHTDSEIRSQRSIILWNLASHRSTAICEKLMTLSRDTNVADNVAEEAFDVLSDIAISPDGAEAAVAANVLDYVAEHLISPESPQQRSIVLLRVVIPTARKHSAEALWIFSSSLMQPPRCGVTGSARRECSPDEDGSVRRITDVRIHPRASSLPVLYSAVPHAR